MRRHLRIVLIVIGGLVSSVFSENTLGAHCTQWDLGLSGGLNLAGMYGPGIENIRDEYRVAQRFSGNGGLHLCYYPLPHLGIEAGLALSGKGFQFFDDRTIEGMDVSYRIKTKNLFLEIPLCLKPTFKNDHQSFYLAGGISAGRMISALRKITADVSYMGNDTTFDISTINYMRDGVPFYIDTMGTAENIPYKELYSLFDISVLLGIGFEQMIGIKSPRYSFFVDLRYALGLVDNSDATATGERLVAGKYYKLFRFFEENNIDPADMGYGADDTPSREPIEKFSTLSLVIGIRYHF